LPDPPALLNQFSETIEETPLPNNWTYSSSNTAAQLTAYLVMRGVRIGAPSASFMVARDQTRMHGTHVVHWDGVYPCSADRRPIQGIFHSG